MASSYVGGGEAGGGALGSLGSSLIPKGDPPKRLNNQRFNDQLASSSGGFRSLFEASTNVTDKDNSYSKLLAHLVGVPNVLKIMGYPR